MIFPILPVAGRCRCRLRRAAQKMRPKSLMYHSPTDSHAGPWLGIPCALPVSFHSLSDRVSLPICQVELAQGDHGRQGNCGRAPTDGMRQLSWNGIPQAFHCVAVISASMTKPPPACSQMIYVMAVLDKKQSIPRGGWKNVRHRSIELAITVHDPRAEQGHLPHHYRHGVRR